MSASVYNDYPEYMPRLPPIQYPSLFGGLKRISFRHILDSKFLALAALLQAIGTFVVLITIITPFWFKLTLSPTESTFGSDPVVEKLTINTGLFYMSETEFDNIAFLNKFTGRDVVPKPLIVAQVASVIGTCLLISCLAGTIILVFRRFASLTATLFLAFFSSIAGICQLVVFCFALSVVLFSTCAPSDDGCKYEDNLVWRMIPIYKQIYRVEPHLTPYVEASWALFISILGAVLIIAASALIWIESFILYRSITEIRYQQLRKKRDPNEKDVDAISPSGEKYVYRPLVQHVPQSYGMQPVVYMAQPYGGGDVFLPSTAPVHPRPGVGFSPQSGVGFSPREYSDSDSDYQGRPPSPGFVKRPLPSETSSVSAGPNISREINI